MAQDYTVKLVKDFKFAQRVRAGVTVTKDGYTGPLTDDQLDAISGDSCFVVSKVAPNATNIKAEATPAKVVGKVKK